MRTTRRLMLVTLLVLAILTIQGAGIATAVYIPPPEPDPTPTTYLVRGTVLNAQTSGYVSGATVQLYASGILMGTTTTSATGYFSKYVTSYDTITSFTAKITKSGYYTRSVTKDVFDTVCSFGTILLTPIAPPPSPAISNVVARSTGFAVTIAWDMTWGSGATAYSTSLWWGTDSDFTGESPYATYTSGSTHYSVSIQGERVPNVYWYKIDASNGNGAGTTYATPVGPNSLVLKHFPTDDTFTYAEMPDTNFDTDATWYNRMIVATGDPESPGLYRGWLKFQILSPRYIQSARLWVYAYALQPYGHGTITAYAIGTNWEEETITYRNSKDMPVGSALSTDTSGSAGSWDSWDITALARSAEVISVLLGPSGGQMRGAYYYTREYSDVGLRPYLEMVYSGPTEYTLVGQINDNKTKADVPGALLDIFRRVNGVWEQIGVTTSSSDDGRFSYPYSSYDTIDAFKVLARCAGYSATEKAASYSTNPFISFQEVLLEPVHRPWIASNEFDYVLNQESDDYVYSQFWTVDNPGHETVCIYGTASVYEIVAEGATSSAGHVGGLVDLNMWTGIGDLEVEIRVAVHSDYYGPLDVTNLEIGISERDNKDEVLWFWRWSWTYTRDVNFIVLRAPIDKSAWPDLQDPDLYRFFWGYYGEYDTLWGRSVTIDYVRFMGEMYPIGALEHNRAGFTTTPSIEYYTYDHEHDSDLVQISHSTKVHADNVFGFGSGDLLVESGICVAMDSDRDEYTITYSNTETDYTEYNVVDKVRIRVYVYDVEGNAVQATIWILGSLANEGTGAPETNPVAEGLIGLILETIGLCGPVGPYIKYAGHFVMFLYTAAVNSIEWNTLTLDSQDNYAEATFDFGNYGLGSTDFKMQILMGAGLDPDVYRVSVEYEVTLKHVTHADRTTEVFPGYEQKTSWTTEQMSSPLLFTDAFNYIRYAADQPVRYHVVEFLSPIDASVTLSKVGQETSIYDTVYGDNWKIVLFRDEDTSIRITATVPTGYSFSSYTIRSWRYGVAVPAAMSDSSSSLVWVLQQGWAFYRFDAYYH